MDCEKNVLNACKISTVILVGSIFTSNAYASASCANPEIIDNYADAAVDLVIADPEAIIDENGDPVENPLKLLNR